MLDELFMNTYRTASSRAFWHPYDGGIYHITICTESRKFYFGRIENDTLEPKMHLSIIGRYADEQLKNVSVHYPYAQIPLFTIMPNHIHNDYSY